MQLMLPLPRDGTMTRLKVRRVFRLRLEPLGDGYYVFHAKSFTQNVGRLVTLQGQSYNRPYLGLL
jgi:hypothetical protein